MSKRLQNLDAKTPHYEARRLWISEMQQAKVFKTLQSMQVLHPQLASLADLASFLEFQIDIAVSKVLER
ncbi:hypothetical protein [Vibrio mediterranei]|uniref:hypothetical protein n=1 Tax=Vibrio mediterranei TaxID=689 RepID=UPI00117F61F9|nr:hypothetical protein [Vibrio mediterranei]